MNPNHYSYQVSWSDDDGEYVASVLEFPSLSWLSGSAAGAIAGLVDVVSDVISDMEGSGEPVPVPLGERTYSGKFNVRMSPTLHRRLAIAAQTEGVSLNALAVQRLARTV